MKKSRDKHSPTPKKNKWDDPLFRQKLLGPHGHKSKDESWNTYAERKGIKMPKELMKGENR